MTLTKFRIQFTSVQLRSVLLIDVFGPHLHCLEELYRTQEFIPQEQASVTQVMITFFFFSHS